MVSRKKIREFLAGPQLGYSPASTEILNNLTESIFPHTSSNGIDIAYIPSELVTGKLFGGTTKSQVGDHELSLLQKVFGLSSEHQVLILSGPKGCGKTTTIKHIFDLTRKIPSQNDNKYPIIYTPVWLDLNEEIFRKVSSEGQANSVIIDQLCNHIHAEIASNRSEWISKETELTEFWSFELEKIKEDKTGRSVFRYIASQLDMMNKDGYPDDLSLGLESRYKLLEKIQSHGGENWLEYLLRLLSFIRSHFANASLFWIVIDNLDGASLAMQRAAVVITRRFLAVDKSLGIRFLVVARPETLESRGLRVDFSDLVDHVSISPSTLIENRIDVFLQKSDIFRTTCPAITKKHYQDILRFTKKIRNKERDWAYFKKFVDTCSGRSLRNGLLIAEGIIKVHTKDISDPRSNVHDAIRVCIRRGLETFDAERNSVIEQLFGVRYATGDHTFLVKPRILTLLIQNKSTQLGIIMRQLELFGYSIEHTVIPALNDILRPETQLLRSNGRHEYSYTDALTSTGDTLAITKAGEGYINELFGDLNYLQEVMLDVSVNELPKAAASLDFWLPEKIDLIRRFIEILFRQDRKEMDSYLAQPTDAIMAISSYIKNFGAKEIITSTLCQQVKQPIDRLIEAEKRHLSNQEFQERGWADILLGYDSLGTLIYNSNIAYFGEEEKLE